MIDRIGNNERDEIWCCKKCSDTGKVITDNQLASFVDNVADLCSDGWMEDTAREEAFSQLNFK